MTHSRTDALKAALAAELDAHRAQIDGAGDLKRAELIFVFDERSGDPLDVIFRTESRRRVARQHDTANGRLSVAAGR